MSSNSAGLTKQSYLPSVSKKLFEGFMSCQSLVRSKTNRLVYKKKALPAVSEAKRINNFLVFLPIFWKIWTRSPDYLVLNANWRASLLFQYFCQKETVYFMFVNKLHLLKEKFVPSCFAQFASASQSQIKPFGKHMHAENSTDTQLFSCSSFACNDCFTKIAFKNSFLLATEETFWESEIIWSAFSLESVEQNRADVLYASPTLRTLIN